MKLNLILEKIKNKEDISYHTINDSLQIYTLKDKNRIGYEIIIRITSKCNLNCEYCFIEHNVEYFKNKHLRILINKLSELNLKDSIITISGGEPTIIDYFYDFIEILSKTKAIIRIQTNATNIINLDRLIKFKENLEFFVSLPSGTKQTYKIITGSDKFKIVINNIKEISNFFKITINHVLYKKNYGEIDKLIEIIKSFNKNITLNISNLGLTDKFSTEDKFEKYEKIINSIKPIILNARNQINIKFTTGGGCGFPLCTIKDIYDIKSSPIISNKTIISYGSTEKKFYKNKNCLSCNYNEYCQGFLKEYILRFEDKEIKNI